MHHESYTARTPVPANSLALRPAVGRPAKSHHRDLPECSESQPSRVCCAGLEAALDCSCVPSDSLITILVPLAPLVATMEPVIRVEPERVEALELLGMTLAHLNDAEARAETSPRVPLLMAIRDKLALGLREEM